MVSLAETNITQMKTPLLCLLSSLLSLPVLAQTIVPNIPGQPIVGDSTDWISSPGVKRMSTGFYLRPGDPPNVMRANLDNMPVKNADPNRQYSMLNPRLNRPYRYQMPLPDSLRRWFRLRP